MLLIAGGLASPQIAQSLSMDPTMVDVKASNTGSVRFANCAFWGPCNQIARISGAGTVGFGDCTFVQWDRNKEGRHALQVESGSVIIRGCEFEENKPQVSLSEAVKRAVITDNLIKGKLRVATQSKGNVMLSNNASDEVNLESGKK